MLDLLFNGEYTQFALILIVIVISLTFHEFGHALTAKLYGDDTAQRQGRLTLNPAAHIDPLGLAMVAMVGFGYAKPVPTDPRNFRSVWADFFVSAAGPGMNLLLAVIAINFYGLALQSGWGFAQNEGVAIFLFYMTLINLTLMIFNLIPLGPLDGHYILPYFLPRELAQKYRALNHQYGNQLLMLLIVLSIFGLPVFSTVMNLGDSLLPLITFIRP